jgi:Methyltransferase domain
MEHFYSSIQGWFDWENIYRGMVTLAPQDTPSVFVELGAWKGKSSAYLVTEVVNSNKPIKVYVVDAWDGRGHTNPDGSSEYNEWQEDIDAGLFETFTKNLEPVQKHYVALRKDTVAAAADFEDGTVDFVWIDTTQDYDMVNAEIQAWLPKIRSGGWIGGHDYFASPTVIGRLVAENFQHYRTDHQSWYARVGITDTSALDQELAKGTVFSQAVGPDQSNAYLRGKYAALGGQTAAAPNSGVTLDRPEYLRSKYAVKF